MCCEFAFQTLETLLQYKYFTCNTYKVTNYKVSSTTSHNTIYKVGTNKTCVNNALKIDAVINLIKKINCPTALLIICGFKHPLVFSLPFPDVFRTFEVGERSEL